VIWGARASWKEGTTTGEKRGHNDGATSPSCDHHCATSAGLGRDNECRVRVGVVVEEPSEFRCDVWKPSGAHSSLDACQRYLDPFRQQVQDGGRWVVSLRKAFYLKQGSVYEDLFYCGLCEWRYDQRC
jgi:hypothetical protein